MTGEGAEENPVCRPVSSATVLVTALLLFALGTGAWVAWQVAVADGAPAPFRDRPALPQCSPITVPQGRQVPTALQECLLGAAAQRDGAEVLVTSSTTEGDPIATYYRVLPGGDVEIFSDATADSSGSGRWSHTRCPDVAALESFDTCRSV